MVMAAIVRAFVGGARGVAAGRARLPVSSLGRCFGCGQKTSQSLDDVSRSPLSWRNISRYQQLYVFRLSTSARHSEELYNLAPRAPHDVPLRAARVPALPELQPGPGMLRVRHGRRVPDIQLRPVQGDVPSPVRRDERGRRGGRHRHRRDVVPVQHPGARGRGPRSPVLPEQGHAVGRPPEPVHRRAVVSRRGARGEAAPGQDRGGARAQDLRVQLFRFENRAPDGHRRQPEGAVRAVPDAGTHGDGVPRPEQRPGARGAVRRRRHQVHQRARRRPRHARALAGRRASGDGVGEGHVGARVRHGERDAPA